MHLYLLLLHLVGAVALLLWSVRMVRTGVERSHAPALRRALCNARGGPLRLAAIGAVAAVVLQSSTAVAMLAAGFAGAGALTVAIGLALMLGADVGSAIVVQVFSLDLSWLVPVLLIVGSLLFSKGPDRVWRQGGRILIGLSLIYLSLDMIAAATAPLRETQALPQMLEYLRDDFVTAFLIGAVFTWLVHSSVAAVLLVASFAAQSILPLEVALSLMLGANLGAGLIAVGLTNGSPVASRQIAGGNLAFRGTFAVASLLAINLAKPDLSWIGGDAGQVIVNLHLGFNVILLCVCLPLIPPLTRILALTYRSTGRQLGPPPVQASGALDGAVIGTPALALASATREILRLAELVERMLAPVMQIYESGNPAIIKEVKQLEKLVDEAQSEIKLYLARISYSSEAESRRGRELSSFAINLEHIADTISTMLLKLAEIRRKKKLQFSRDGWSELSELHDRVLSNMRLALNVLVSKDRAAARQLLVEKDAMGAAERDSHCQHLTRLRQGAARSIETSNIHLETVRALKTINSLFASVAYPILKDHGDLLASRLVDQETS